MTWLLGKIIANPLMLMWIVLGAFGFGASMAGGAAWKIQGLRITAAEQEFTDYKQLQTKLILEAKQNADKQRDETREQFTGAVKVLAADIEAGEVFRRCVAAGRCGVVRNVPACTGGRLSPASGTDAAGQNTIPATGSAATEVVPGVVTDCAYTTLQLNHLQADIEKQPGYK